MDMESCNFRISSSLYLKSARAKRKITYGKARETVIENTLWLGRSPDMRLDSGAGGWLEKHPEGPDLGQTPELKGDFQDWTRTFGTEKQIFVVSDSSVQTRNVPKK